jgi:O-antigen ligase
MGRELDVALLPCLLILALSVPGLANMAAVGLAVLLIWVATRHDGPLPALCQRIGLVLLSAVISTVASDEGLRPAAIIGLLTGVAVFVPIATLCDVGTIRMMFAAFALQALVWSADILAIAATNPWLAPASWIERCPSTLFVTPNDAIFLVAVIPMAIAVFVTARSATIRVVALTSIVTSLLAAVALRSRGAVISGLVAAGFTMGIARPQLLSRAIMAFILLVVGVDAFAGFALAARFGETWLSRVPPWMVAIEMSRDAPILGHGPQTYGLLFDWYASSFDFSGWMPPRHIPWAHNLYLETLAEQGALGLTALSWLLFGGVVLGLRSCRSIRKDVAALAAGATGSLVTVLVAGLFEVSLLRLWAIVSLFAALGSIAALARSDAAPMQTASRK